MSIEVSGIPHIIEKVKAAELREPEVIRRNPEMTHRVLGEELSVSAATIQRTPVRLQKEGKVIREGSNRKGKWIVLIND